MKNQYKELFDEIIKEILKSKHIEEYICKINYKNNENFGILSKFPLLNRSFPFCILITAYHLFYDFQDKTLSISFQEKKYSINSRIFYENKEYDIILFEIIEDDQLDTSKFLDLNIDIFKVNEKLLKKKVNLNQDTFEIFFCYSLFSILYRTGISNITNILETELESLISPYKNLGNNKKKNLVTFFKNILNRLYNKTINLKQYSSNEDKFFDEYYNTKSNSSFNKSKDIYGIGSNFDEKEKTNLSEISLTEIFKQKEIFVNSSNDSINSYPLLEINKNNNSNSQKLFDLENECISKSEKTIKVQKENEFD